MTEKLDSGTVKGLLVPAGKRDAVVYDSEQPGLFLRKFASGKAIYGVKYYVNGEERKVHLYDANVTGRIAKTVLANARKEAGDLRAKARLGTDVVAAREAARAAKAEEEKRAGNTLGVIVAKYLAAREAELRPRSFLKVKRHLEKHWKPLHERPIHTITRDDITDTLKKIADKSGKVTADRAKSSLGTLFIWALDEKYVTGTPVAFIKRKVGKRKGNRKRTLTATELREIWLATDAVDNEGKRLVSEDYARIVKLAILTGQRRTEIGGLAVNYIIRQAGERAGLDRVHPHTLRHSCGYALAHAGKDMRTIQDYLGHRDPRHTAHYTRTASHRFEGLWR